VCVQKQRTLNPVSKNRGFLAKSQDRQIWNIGVYRRTKPKKLRKKEYTLYLNRGTTLSFLGLGEVMLRKKTLAINLMKNRFTKIEHLV
jgi:hypothetical protein